MIFPLSIESWSIDVAWRSAMSTVNTINQQSEFEQVPTLSDL